MDEHSSRAELAAEVRRLNARLAGLQEAETQRDLAEQAVDLNERRFRALIENSADGISLLAPDGVILYTSPATTAILGFPVDQFIGRNAFDLVHPDDLPAVRTTFADVLRHPGKPFRAELRCRKLDDNYLWVEGTGVNLLDDPSVRAIVVNYRDISARRRLEQHMLHAQKLEAVGRLAGGIAHQFNNLLTVVAGYSDLLLAQVAADHPAHAMLHEIRQAGQRIADLTRQLLAFGRKALLTPAALDVNTVVQNVEKVLRHALDDDIELCFDLEPQLAAVKADASALEQVLWNLAVNARDAMPRGGRLSITTRNVTVDDAYVRRHPDVQPGAYVELVMQDSGHGMDEAVRSRVFEPFFTTKESGSGIGLGLSSVFGIVKQSGGHIEVQSQPGVGAAFHVFLPCATAATLPSAETVPAPLPVGSETILVADDEPGLLRLAATVLRSCGYEVLEARDGQQALDVAGAAGVIDLLLTDVVMPNVNGRELALRLQRQRPGLKVLLVSGFSDDPRLQRDIGDARFAYLPKPFTPAELAHKVRAILDG